MNESEERILRLANAFVWTTEQVDLENMDYEARAAIHHAEGCGCHSCLALAESTHFAYSTELIRLTSNPSDHEEEWITNLALKKVRKSRLRGDTK
jgi:hypothetical protein